MIRCPLWFAPFAKVNAVVDKYELYMAKGVYLSVCVLLRDEPGWKERPLAAVSKWKYMLTAMATVRSHDQEWRLRAVGLAGSRHTERRCNCF